MVIDMKNVLMVIYMTEIQARWRSNGTAFTSIFGI
jgi:hypothetical protein